MYIGGRAREERGNGRGRKGGGTGGGMSGEEGKKQGAGTNGRGRLGWRAAGREPR